MSGGHGPCQARANTLPVEEPDDDTYSLTTVPDAD